MKGFAHAALALLLCAGALAQETPAPEDPVQRIAQIEARLLAAQHVAIDASIESTGFIRSKLKGHSEWRDRNRANLAYSGEFAGKPAELVLASDGRALEVHNGPDLRREAPGKESNRAQLVGFVRMGLLHNLARLNAAQGPEHGGGGVDQWVSLDAFRPTTYAQGSELEGATSFGFDFVIAGETAGSARLWLDPASGLPRRRVTTLYRPEGETTVVEEYTHFVVE